MILRWSVVWVLLVFGQGHWGGFAQNVGGGGVSDGVGASEPVVSSELQSLAIQMLRQKISELNQESVPGLIAPNTAIHDMAVRVLRKKMEELAVAEKSALGFPSNSAASAPGLAPANNSAMHDRALEILRAKLAQLEAWPENNPEEYREAIHVSIPPRPKVTPKVTPAQPSFSIPPTSLPQPVIVKRSVPKSSAWRQVPESKPSPKELKPSQTPVFIPPPKVAESPSPTVPLKETRVETLPTRQPVSSVPPPNPTNPTIQVSSARVDSSGAVSISPSVSASSSNVQLEFVEANDPGRIVVVGSDSKPPSSDSNFKAPSSALLEEDSSEETALTTTTNQLPYVSTPLQERAPVVAEIKPIEKVEEGFGETKATPPPAPKTAPLPPGNPASNSAVNAPVVSSSPPIQRVAPIPPNLQNAMKSVILSSGGSVQSGGSARSGVVERDLTPEEIDQRKIQLLEYYLEDRIATQEYYRQRAKVKEVPIIFVNPPPPTRSKEQKLVKLLELYLVDEITPREYHQVRAMIISEP